MIGIRSDSGAGLPDLTGTSLADLSRLDENLLGETLERLLFADRTRVWDQQGATCGTQDGAPPSPGRA